MFKNNWNLVLKRKTVFNSVFLENLFTSYSWKSRKIKPGKFQIGQKYFAKEIRKSLKHQKIIVTVEKLWLLWLQLVMISWVHSATCFILGFVSSNQWKNTVLQVVLAIWGTFLYEDKCNFNSYEYSHKLAFITFSSFRMNQKHQPYT